MTSSSSTEFPGAPQNGSSVMTRPAWQAYACLQVQHKEVPISAALAGPEPLGRSRSCTGSSFRCDGKTTMQDLAGVIKELLGP